MKTRTEGKDSAARNRKGCIVEICIVLFFLLIALIPVVLLISKMLQEASNTILIHTAHNLPSEAEETEKNGTGSLTAEEARPRSIETTAPDAPARLPEEASTDIGVE